MDNFNIKKTKTIQRKYDFVVFLNLEHNEIVFVGKEIQKKKTFFRWVFFCFKKTHNENTTLLYSGLRNSTKLYFLGLRLWKHDFVVFLNP